MGKRYNRNSFSLLNAISAMCLTNNKWFTYNCSNQIYFGKIRIGF